MLQQKKRPVRFVLCCEPYYVTGSYEISADIPFIASNVMGEFSTNYAEVVPYAPNYDVHSMLAYMDDEAVKQQYISKYGDEYGPQIMDAFGMLDAMASYGGTSPKVDF